MSNKENGNIDDNINNKLNENNNTDDSTNNNINNINSDKKACFHLPGLFEFYELYKVFLPLFYEHREYFYDWCDIGSIYGAPADCIWGGGRAGYGDGDAREVFSLMAEYGISARLTFSNSLLTREHLSDVKCNKLCELLNAASELHSSYKVTDDYLVTSEYASEDYSIDNSIKDNAFENEINNNQIKDDKIRNEKIKHNKIKNENVNVKNGIIVHSDILLDYLKNKYPEFYFVSSTTKVLTDYNDLLDEVNRDDFSYVVPDFRLNKCFDKLDTMTQEQKCKIEFLCNECCWFGCYDRKACYEAVSRMNLGENCPGHICVSPDAGEGYRFSKAMSNPAFISVDDICNIYLPKGFSNFKIEGRGLGSALVLEFLLYYMTKTEYQINVREAIYLDNMLDLF